jgi:TonB-linked SusC/RagA family outer membrane protein
MKVRLLLTALVLLYTQWAYAQSRAVTGSVKDKATNEPIPGVTVVVENTQKGSFTDVNGKYSIEIADNNAVLVFSMVGYGPQKIVVGNQANIDIILENNAELDEVVVTALGLTREKKAIGYSSQELDGRSITNARESNVVSTLSGKVAGVQVNNSGGTAGASSSIIIRGQNTISGDNQALFVVDGIIIDNSHNSSSSPTEGRNGYLSSVGNSNRAIDIPQEDIASMTVLKGAAATALYGSLGANGVIIITTKRGQKGQGGKGINVNVSSGWEWSSVNKMVPLQKQFAQGYSGANPGQVIVNPDISSSPLSSASWGANIDTLVYLSDPSYQFSSLGRIVGQSSNPGGTPVKAFDHPADFFRTGFKNYYSVDLGGANERSDFYMSAGYENTDGIVPNNSFKKYNFGINAGTKLSDKLSVRTSAKFVNSGGIKIEQGSNISGVMLGLLRTPPTFDNSNGFGEDAADEPSAYMILPQGVQRNYRGGPGYDNPFWTVNQNPLKDDVRRMIGNVEFNYQVLPWLRAMYRVGLDHYIDYRNQHFAIGSNQWVGGQVTLNTFNSNQFTEDLVLTANKDLSEKLRLNATLGHNRYSDELNQIYVQGDNLVVPNFYDISNAQSQLSRNVNTRERLSAYYGMAELGYNYWLYLTLTGRLEKASSLPTNNNTYFYPSASVGAVFTEALKIKSKILTFGKIRASYSEVGLSSPFAYITRQYYPAAYIADGWTTGLSSPINGTASFLEQPSLSDPNLKPERMKEFEVGVEMKFWQDRIGLDLSYYNNKNNDLIFPIPIAASSGYEEQYTNAGSMTNQGLEIMLNTIPVRSKKGIQWNLDLNFTRNRNEVTKLANGVDQVFIGGFEGSSIRAVEGQPYGSIFGFGYLRDTDGNVVIGEDGFPMLDPIEKAFGTAQANWLMGIRNSISYKGFTLSALLDIRKGGVMWNGTRSALYFFGTHGDTENRGESHVFEGRLAQYDDQGNMVTDANGVPITSTDNNITVVLDQDWYRNNPAGNGFTGNNTEEFIEDAGWVRLRDLTLTYKLAPKALEKTPFTSIEISVYGRNLWLSTDYSGIDPETSLTGATNAQGIDYFNMPNTKSYGIGLRMSF